MVVCWLCARQQLEHAHNQPNWVTGISLLAWLAGVLWSGPRLLGAEAGSSLAEVYGIKVFDQEAGLDQYALASVAATADGYLWYCGFEAVGRFDGTQFSDLSAAAGSPLAGIMPRKLFVDRPGRLWVGAASRILCGEIDRWHSFGVAEGVPNGIIRAFAEDAQGVLWVASASNVVRRVGARFESVRPPANLSEEVCYLAAEREGTVWHAGNLTLSRWERDQFVAVLTAGQTQTNKIMGLLGARFGGLWVAFERDIKLRQGGSWTKVWPRPEGIRGDAVEMLEDVRGNLWVGGWRSGLVVYSPAGVARQATTREGLANNSVSGLAEDGEGNVWLSSNGGSLVRLRPLAFRSYGRDAGLTQIANSVAEEAPGRMWIGTHGDGIARWEAGRITPQNLWPEPNYLSGMWVHGVLRDRAGDTWAATYSPGLLRYHQGAWERVPKEQTGNRIILSLFEDRQGRLWVGTASGLAWREGRGEGAPASELPLAPTLAPLGPREARAETTIGGGGSVPLRPWREPVSFSVCDRSSGLPKMEVQAIAQDGAGNIWVCGRGDGLFRGQPGQFARFPVPGLATNAAFQSLAGGRDGSVWVGVEGAGLVRIREGQCVTFGAEQGLPATELVAVVEDDAGDLWLGGSQSVVRVNRASLEAVARRERERLECQVFDRQDGLPGPVRSGHQPACWKASDGRIWFATLRGIAVVDPQEVLPKLPPPTTAITEVMVEGKPWAGWEAAAGPLLLPAGLRQLSITYSAVRLGAPDRLRFQCRQRPDEVWKDVENERRSHRYAPSFGRYRFEVRAADIDGVWGPGATLAYVVQPFYWQTAWFQALVLVSLASGVGSAVAQVLRRRHRREAEANARQAAYTRNLIQAEEAERQRIALELHDGLGQGLLVIATFAGLAQRPGKSAEVVQGNLSEIATTSKEMLENLRQLTRSLRPQLLDSLGLTRSLQTLLDQTARTDLRVESDLENVDALCPPPGNINLYRIVQEALANVLKHASATKVRVSLRADAALVRLSVADDGGGFAVAEPSPRMGREAVSGLGMPGMAERARLLGGSLRVESRPGAGTLVVVEIPLNIQHRTSNTEQPTPNSQHRTANTEQPTPNSQ